MHYTHCQRTLYPLSADIIPTVSGHYTHCHLSRGNDGAEAYVLNYMLDTVANTAAPRHFLAKLGSAAVRSVPTTATEARGYRRHAGHSSTTSTLHRNGSYHKKKKERNKREKRTGDTDIITSSTATYRSWFPSGVAQVALLSVYFEVRCICISIMSCA